MNCTGITPLQDPPAIAPGGYTVLVVDENGNTKMLSRPSGKSILIFDGDKVYFADGSDALSIFLNNLRVSPGPLDGLIAVNGDGRMLSLVNESDTKKVLTSFNGHVFFENPSEGVATLPAGTKGILVRTTTVDGTSDAWLSTQGLVYINNLGQVTVLGEGIPGQSIIADTSGNPAWASPASGNIAGGVGGIGLAGVRCASVSASVVGVDIPSFELSNGTDTVTFANIHTGIDLAGPVGLGGLDTGVEAANKWYYVYVTSDGASLSAIASLSPTAPDLSATTHTYYALCSVFRNDASANIVPFIQTGRSFAIKPTTWSTNFSVTTAFNPIASGINLNTIIPPGVSTVSGLVGGSTDATVPRTMILASTLDGIGMQFIGSRENTGSIEGFKYDVGTFKDLTIQDPTAPVIYARANQNDNKRKIQITGYSI